MSFQPKVQAKARPKVKSNAAVKPAPKRKAEVEPSFGEDDEAPLGASVGSGSSHKLRRVDRRDTEAQVDRVIQSRLAPQFPIEAINGVVNAKGEHVRTFIARHIRENRGSQRYLTSKFWTEFFAEFDLQVCMLNCMPQPCLEEEVDEQIVSALKVAHSDNPSKRSVEPIERLLETMRKPNYTEFYGLVAASQEAPTMTRHSSLRMKVAILGCISRPSSSDQTRATLPWQDRSLALQAAHT